jgi:hypothetical protein
MLRFAALVHQRFAQISNGSGSGPLLWRRSVKVEARFGMEETLGALAARSIACFRRWNPAMRQSMVRFASSTPWFNHAQRGESITYGSADETHQFGFAVLVWAVVSKRCSAWAALHATQAGDGALFGADQRRPPPKQPGPAVLGSRIHL